MERKETRVLGNNGVTPDDIKAEEMFFKILVHLDHAVFPDNTIKRVERYTASGKHRRIAIYKHARKTKPPTYGVWMVGLAEVFRKFTSGHHVFIRKGRRWKTKKSSAITLSMEDVCLIIAVHEVRHRMQREGRARMFSRGYAKKAYAKWYSKKVTRRSLLAYVLNFSCHYFNILKEDLQKVKRTKKFIAKKTSQVEFDATVIEFLVANIIFLYPRCDLNDIAKIIRMGPPKL